MKVEIQWPPRLREVLNALSFMNFNIELAAPECSTNFDANARLNLVLSSPFAAIFLILIYAATRWLTHKGEQAITLAELANKVRLLLIGALVLGSTFFVKGVLGGLDCTLNDDGKFYLDIQAEIECDWNQDERYSTVFIKGVAGFSVWLVLMAMLVYSFTRESGPEKYAFLTQKMEDQYYWWELLLLLRKLLIMAAGLLNTSTPSRGWYLSSLVIIASLAAHAYARPFKDPWVDATEGLSLWSTLFVFQGGMVWNMDPDGELAALIEVGAIAMITATTVLALYVEYRVYQDRHGVVHGEAREQDFDTGTEEVTENPLHLIRLSLSRAAILELQFAPVSEGVIVLKEVGQLAKKQHPKLRSGVFLREVDGYMVHDLGEIESLLAKASDESEISLAFSEKQPTLGGDVIAATNAMDRVAAPTQSAMDLTTFLENAATV